ncbi:Uncharacterized protein BC141101_05960 [Bacillus toyonensis]|nr:hypothetical protein IGI_05373 [Bacillus toyonensis]EOP45778.1 hypothetical protein IKI_05351 [Bacillus toyonensis]SCN20574.1 Uncharacterized protein BC141101_05960 [Bacillus toyonensis]
MNVWMFAGCMFLVAVFLNILLLFWSQNGEKAEK